ncbi:MAG: type II toxin-antitoxin system death-on-curing family toxin [Bacteroidales bacterium]|nr:type II toxin-antitoxin system death-on-curing family toxin [Bacteroidales bacterium]
MWWKKRNSRQKITRIRTLQTLPNIFPKRLYPDIVDKAAALIEGILLHHPFIEGNKRTGYVLMRLLLLNEGLDISASQDDKYEFVISIAKGEYDYNQIKDWISNKLTSITK